MSRQPLHRDFHTEVEEFMQHSFRNADWVLGRCSSINVFFSPPQASRSQCLCECSALRHWFQRTLMSSIEPINNNCWRQFHLLSLQFSCSLRYLPRFLQFGSWYIMAGREASSPLASLLFGRISRRIQSDSSHPHRQPHSPPPEFQPPWFATSFLQRRLQLIPTLAAMLTPQPADIYFCSFGRVNSFPRMRTRSAPSRQQMPLPVSIPFLPQWAALTSIPWGWGCATLPHGSVPLCVVFSERERDCRSLRAIQGTPSLDPEI